MNIFSTLCIVTSQEPKNYLSPSPPSPYTAEDDGVTNVYGDYDEYKSTAASHADILHEYFKHLNHNYQQQQVALDNFDIHVKHGRTIFREGPYLLHTAFSFLKVPTITFTTTNLLTHYSK